MKEITKTELIKLLDEKNTNDKLAEYFECGTSSIKRAKVKFELVGYKTNSDPLSIAHLKAIEELSKQDKGVKEISELLGISDYRIKKYCSQPLYKKLIINGNTTQSNRCQIGSLSVLLENTAECAYLIGYLAADGCVTDTGYISCTSIDRELVDIVAQLFKANITLDNTDRYYKVQVKDFRILEKIKLNTNLYSRKSWSNYVIPTWIKNNKNYLDNFTVGFFNGDGCAYSIPNSSRVEVSIEQHSSQEENLKYLASIYNFNTYAKEGKFRISTKKLEVTVNFAKIFCNNKFALQRKVDKLKHLL